mgnify:CR=1 FL=1
MVYYGDEIGMGDNYYLGDRNGVRTPMQWSADANAGFTTGTPCQDDIYEDNDFRDEAATITAGTFIAPDGTLTLTGDLVHTGPTGTNVTDLVLGYKPV